MFQVDSESDQKRLQNKDDNNSIQSRALLRFLNWFIYFLPFFFIKIHPCISSKYKEYVYKKHVLNLIP